MPMVNEEWNNGQGEYICPHCDKVYAKKGIMCHIWRTHGDGKDHNPLADPIIKEIVRQKNTGKTGWAKGLTKETDSRIAKMAKSLTGKSGPKHSKKTKQKISIIKKKLYASGWVSTAGRTKKITYESKIAGIVKLDGSWELLVAQYFDRIEINWKRNTKRFLYINLDNKESYYTPDFWIDDWQIYVEVKGYETDLDRCKWRQFPEKLIVWKKEHLQKLNII